MRAAHLSGATVSNRRSWGALFPSHYTQPWYTSIHGGKESTTKFKPTGDTMSMKSSDSPRRVYVRAGLPIVCFNGLYFASKKSSVKVDAPVTVETGKTVFGKSTVKVVQGKLEEKWSEIEIVRPSRGSR